MENNINSVLPTANDIHANWSLYKDELNEKLTKSALTHEQFGKICNDFEARRKAVFDIMGEFDNIYYRSMAKRAILKPRRKISKRPRSKKE
jgi:hypothetical protein